MRNQETDQATEARKLGEYLQTIPTKLLVAATKGRVDVAQLIRTELGNRYLSLDGKWIGSQKQGGAR